MFTANHVLWIAACAAFVSAMLWFCIKKDISIRRAGHWMTAICAFSEISKIMCDMMQSPEGGMVLDPRSLPFHLCSLMLFGVLLITFGRDGAARQTIIDFMAVMGSLGSACAILIPTNGTSFTSLPAYQCFVYHGGLLWFSLYLAVRNRQRLGARALGRNVVLLLALVLATLYINSILSVYGTNFMYLVRPPMDNLPYLNLDCGWYAYFFRLLALGAALVTLFHLPFILCEWKTRQKAAK